MKEVGIQPGRVWTYHAHIMGPQLLLFSNLLLPVEITVWRMAADFCFTWIPGSVLVCSPGASQCWQAQ